ncbi:MAG: hypothetical protein LUQ32_05760 [Methanomicrobiales archaeon]|nr:hypothetical protein [Methanomicrobiales archaeon]
MPLQGMSDFLEESGTPGLSGSRVFEGYPRHRAGPARTGENGAIKVFIPGKGNVGRSQGDPIFCIPPEGKEEVRILPASESLENRGSDGEPIVQYLEEEEVVTCRPDIEFLKERYPLSQISIDEVADLLHLSEIIHPEGYDCIRFAEPFNAPEGNPPLLQFPGNRRGGCYHLDPCPGQGLNRLEGRNILDMLQNDCHGGEGILEDAPILFFQAFRKSSAAWRSQ